jgi:hypothetical protein
LKTNASRVPPETLLSSVVWSGHSCPLLPSRHLPLSLTLALGILCASIVGCTSADSRQQKAQAAAPRPVSVAVAKVQQQDVPVYLSGLGSVTAFNTANIKSRVDGQIMKVNFTEGQNVKQGESADHNRCPALPGAAGAGAGAVVPRQALLATPN